MDSHDRQNCNNKGPSSCRVPFQPAINRIHEQNCIKWKSIMLVTQTPHTHIHHTSHITHIHWFDVDLTQCNSRLVNADASMHRLHIRVVSWMSLYVSVLCMLLVLLFFVFSTTKNGAFYVCVYLFFFPMHFVTHTRKKKESTSAISMVDRNNNLRWLDKIEMKSSIGQ